MEIAIAVIAIVAALVISFICATIAQRKGRNVVLWAILGIFFPIVGLIVISLLSSKAPAGGTAS